jgi:hypothetical protein
MNEIAKRESTTAPADGWDDTAAEAEARVIRGSLLKFADWKWSSGKEKEAIEVKEGRPLVAVATAAAWVKWQGASRSNTGCASRACVCRTRELGDNDRAGWEAGPDGALRDPWLSTRFVHMIDPRTAEFSLSRPQRGPTA